VYQHTNTTVHVFIPWDKSEAMKPGPDYSIFHNVDDVPASQDNRLMERIVNSPALKNQYLDALSQVADAASELISGDGRGWMEREVERENDQIQDAVFTDPTKSYTNDDYLAAVDAARVFARQRADAVRAQIARYR
jgi:hypothetical protein